MLQYVENDILQNDLFPLQRSVDWYISLSFWHYLNNGKEIDMSFTFLPIQPITESAFDYKDDKIWKNSFSSILVFLQQSCEKAHKEINDSVKHGSMLLSPTFF